jgi:hypothetical protein
LCRRARARLFVNGVLSRHAQRKCAGSSPQSGTCFFWSQQRESAPATERRGGDGRTSEKGNLGGWRGAWRDISISLNNNTSARRQPLGDKRAPTATGQRAAQAHARRHPPLWLRRAIRRARAERAHALLRVGRALGVAATEPSGFPCEQLAALLAAADLTVPASARVPSAACCRTTLILALRVPHEQSRRPPRGAAMPAAGAIRLCPA